MPTGVYKRTKPNKGLFKKGHIPWHAGKIKVYSVETIEKMRLLKVGKISPRKGKRYLPSYKTVCFFPK